MSTGGGGGGGGAASRFQHAVMYNVEKCGIWYTSHTQTPHISHTNPSRRRHRPSSRHPTGPDPGDLPGRLRRDCWRRGGPCVPRVPLEEAVGVLQEQLLFAERCHRDDHHVILVLLIRQHGHDLHNLEATKLSDANCSLHSPPAHPSIHRRRPPEILGRLAARWPRPGSAHAIAAAAAYRSSAAASSSVLPDTLDRSSDANARNAAAVGGLLSDLRSCVSQVRALRARVQPISFPCLCIFPFLTK
ncbi:hypothetical protein ZWY2020_027006 [Hordeum vulgare]|nr:hypothetical protein ZWY2020_027006 [Hordeum vulgare]